MCLKEQVVISASEYPEDGNHGIEVDQRSMSLIFINKNSWADTHTDLDKYIGWRIVELNKISLTNWRDFSTAAGNLTSKDEVEITLEKKNVVGFTI